MAEIAGPNGNHHVTGKTAGYSLRPLLFCAAAAALNFCNAALADNPASTLFVNVNVFDGQSTGIRKNVSVLVEGNKISGIKPGSMEAPKGATVIDGGGRTLIPGLIDNHVHIFMAGSSQAQLLDPKTTFEMLEATAAEEARKMLMRGYTAVRDVGGPVFGVKRMIDQGKTMGPRIYPSGALISQTSGHGDFRRPEDRAHRFGGGFTKGELLGVGFIADGRDEVLTATRENLRAGATQIKVMAGGGAAYTPKAVRRAIEAGVKCIEHGQLLDEETMKFVAEKGVWISLQSLDEAPPTAPDNIRAKKKQVVDGTANAFVWAKKYKVKLAFGTDLMFDPKQMTKMSTDILKLKQWFTSAEVLKLMTHDNAQLLALSGPRNAYPGKLGVIETGALADMILVDGDPVANLDLVADPDKNFKLIMKDGKIYKNTLQ